MVTADRALDIAQIKNAYLECGSRIMAEREELRIAKTVDCFRPVA
jgi:hypothetical protein